MSCAEHIPEESVEELVSRLGRAERDRPSGPLSASMDLTPRCNLACRHCYIRAPGSADDEMTTRETQAVLDKLAAGGVLFLVLTGGEPLSRRDFREVYLHAKSAGFMVTLFTNATLIDEDLADFLAAHPPRRVEVTVYGHTEATYESVTGIPGSFRRFRHGVDALLQRGILLRLKTILLSDNVREFEDMKAWSASLNCDYRFDALIHGRLDGGLSPVQCRIPPEEAVRLQFSTLLAKADCLKKVQAAGPGLPPREHLFECGAGQVTLHIDAFGNAHPCMLWRNDPYNLRTGLLDANWFNHIRDVRSRTFPEGECRTCSDRSLCSYCPPIAIMETGSPSRASAYYCQLAAERKRLCQVSEAGAGSLMACA